jgi:HPt (histidine-containing phosphotransfer) domain-containing protein
LVEAAWALEVGTLTEKEKQSWQEKARELARQAEAELKSERVRQRLEGARAALDEALESDQAKRVREDAKALGAKARSQVEQTLARDDVQRVREDVHQIGEKARDRVEQTLARDDVQRVREDVHQIGEKAREAVDAAVQRPEAQELRRRVESAIEDVSERLRPAAAEDKKEPPEEPGVS